MITKKLYPHFTDSVKAFQFLNIPNPLNISSYEDLIPYGDDDGYIDLENPPTGVGVSSDNGVLTVIIKRETCLNFDWTSIVARSGKGHNIDNYLSLSYWEYEISSDAPFVYLKVVYSSSYIVSPSTSGVSVEVSYINHDINEGTMVDNTGKWKSHLNLFREISGQLYLKTAWVTNTGNIDTYTTNVKNDRELSTWDASSPDSVNTVNIGFGTDSVSVGTADYICIPKCSVRTSKLMVSPRFGVEFYELSGNSANIVNQSGSVNSAPPKPDGIQSDDVFEVYRLYQNIFLFYVPERYSAWIAQEVVDNGVIKWSSWRVGDDNIKVVVPSYVDIIPFIFMQRVDGQGDIGEWRISYIMRVCSSTDDMFADYAGISTDLTGPMQYPTDNNASNVAIPIEVFFSNVEYLNVYMENIRMGYSNTNNNNYADDISRYFFTQLYISFHTFIQALRMDEFYGANPQICDCGIKLGKFFIPYSQDIVFNGDRRTKRTSCPIEVGDGYIVDNMLAYLNNGNNGNLISLYSGKSVSVDADDVQMHHGIVVGWKNNEYTPLQ